MPRRPRLAAGDLAYHVLNRRVGRLPLFFLPLNGDIRVPLQRVSRILKKSASFVLASLDSHFEHPVWLCGVVSHPAIRDGLWSPREFSRSLLDLEGGARDSALPND